jgi:hypothetical protein
MNEDQHDSSLSSKEKVPLKCNFLEVFQVLSLAKHGDSPSIKILGMS